VVECSTMSKPSSSGRWIHGLAKVLSATQMMPRARQVRAMAAKAPRMEGVSVLGPAPAPLAMLRGRHRRRFLVKCRRDVAPQAFIRAWLRGLKWPGDLRLQIDIDPYSFL